MNLSRVQALERWLSFWVRLNAKGDPLIVYDALKGHYAEPHRTYHNLRHITDCLDEFDCVRELTDGQDTIEMAIWYHDVIYDPRAKDNEERSADAAVATASLAGFPDNFAQTVSSLIMATKHNALPANPDAAWLVDIDLSILGRPSARFDEYERQIRKEYEWVGEQSFRAGRAAILKFFLQRPSLYSTKFFREKYEKTARLNLERSIASLEKS